jgi:hypothetical protein
MLLLDQTTTKKNIKICPGYSICRKKKDFSHADDEREKKN